MGNFGKTGSNNLENPEPSPKSISRNTKKSTQNFQHFVSNKVILKHKEHLSIELYRSKSICGIIAQLRTKDPSKIKERDIESNPKSSSLKLPFRDMLTKSI